MSRLEDRLAAGELVVTAEMPVIDGGGYPEIQRQLAPMKAYLDAVNATDNTSAHAHASPLAVAVALKQVGVEPVMQLTCRDRNRLALQSEIVGAAMHGIENLCCLTGDDVTAGDEPQARRVFDLDGPQLVRVASTLAGGRYLSGRPLVPAPRLFVGAVENPSAPPYEERVRRAMKKALAGARFLQLQICFRPERLARFVEVARAEGLTDRLALIPSVCILRSAASLRFVD
ncbi:MAG: methylenetetrahydrofolate reductase, partial [Solirubrobacteraceae bacterium]|nr:methylenetetrahydrofolate reductase [Solirubrobacteraceae bacterium]